MTPHLVFAALLLSSHSGAPLSDNAALQAYQDGRTGLIIHYPAGWTLDPKAVSFAIVDFPLRRRPPQVLVPMDRAEIGIFALPETAKSVRDSMQSERIGEAWGYHLNQSHLATKHFGVIEVTAAPAEPAVIPHGTQVIYRFELDGRLMGASLIYRGRRKRAYFENTLRSIVENLEMIGAR